MVVAYPLVAVAVTHLPLLCCVVNWRASKIVSVQHRATIVQDPLQTFHLHDAREHKETQCNEQLHTSKNSCNPYC